VGYDVNETNYADARTVTKDTIIEEVDTDYDDASNMILVTTRGRLEDAAGALTDPDSTQPKARRSYVGHWHDQLVLLKQSIMEPTLMLRPLTPVLHRATATSQRGISS